MKIAEYIELVKQAELIDLNGNSRATVSPPPFQGIVEPNRSGKPPVDPRVEQALNAELSSEPNRYRFFSKPNGEPGIGINIPKFKRDPSANPGYEYYKDKYSDRTTGQKVKDLFRGETWQDWWNSRPKSFQEGVKRWLNSEADLVNGQLNQELKLKPRFSAMDLGFSIGLPLVNYEPFKGNYHIRDKVIADSNKYNLNPFWTFMDAVPRTGEEALRQVPNMAGEYLQFGISPMAPVNMATFLPNMVLPKHYQLPTFYKLHNEDNRLRTGEYKKDYSKYDPDLQEKQDQIYQTPNLVADYVGAVVDPFLQWLPGYDKGFGLGLKQRSDNGGIDYQAALKPVIGSESWDKLHGMREGYSEEAIQDLFNKAIANGFTPEEANAAVAYFSNANSKYGNALLMMAMSPKDLYHTGWVLDNIKDSTPDKSIPEYLPSPQVGQFGPSFPGPKKKNPAWLKEQLRLQKIINDQQVFKELYPFYRDIVGTGKTMSDEESKFLDSMLSLPDEGVKEWLSGQEMPNIDSKKWRERMREIASLPYPARYAFLARKPFLYNPEDEDGFNFVNKYYHPDDQEKVLKVLNRLSRVR